MPGFGLLQDQFDDSAVGPLWPQSYGDPVEAGGRGRVPCATGYAALRSASSYTLAWSQVSARVIPPAAGGATTAACSLLVLTSVGGTDAGFVIDAAQSAMGLYQRVGYAEAGAVFLSYDAAAHAWLRLREDAGSLFWETSPDGRTWTVRRTAPTPPWAGDANLSLLFEAHRDTGTADFAEIDDVNINRAGSLAAPARLLAGPGPYARSGPSMSGG